MKRKFLSILLALVLVLSFSLVMATPAMADTLEVGDGKTYTTIQAAIDAAGTGDTINVAAGTYAESLTVNKEVSIIGAGPTTIIDPAIDADGITITADNVVIKDLKMSTEDTAGTGEPSSIAICIKGTDGVEINTVTVETTGDEAMGIWMGETASSNLSILTCNVTINDKGTAIYGAKIDGLPHSNWTITGNTLSAANVPGVNLELYDVDTVLVDDNTFLTTGSVNLVYSSEYSNVGSANISNNVFEGSGDVAGVTPTIWVESDFQGASFGDNTAVDGVRITGNTFNTWANAAIQIGEGVLGYDDVSNVTINSNIFNMTTAHPAILDFTEDATGTGNTFNVSSPATIQDAIDSAFAGETINVAAGTYTESLLIDKANLTIRSLNGKAVTTIQLVDGVGIDIQSGASGFTLGGAVGEGFIVKSSSVGSTTFNIQLTNAPSGVEISYNKIDTTGTASQGISVGAAGATDLTISNNAFTADSSDGSIFGPDVVNVTVSTNTFTGPGGYAIEFVGVTGTSTISGNTITGGYGNGIFIFGASATAQAGTTGVSGLTISGNTVNGCTKGVRLGYSDQSEDIDDVTVEKNTLSSNTVGLYVSDGANVLASNFVIRYNSFIGNTSYGLNNENTLSVTAEYNWWGDVAGPDTTGNTMHNPYEDWAGNAVSENVDYLPWMIRIDLVVENDGWNIVSFPIQAAQPAEPPPPPDEIKATYWFDSSTQYWNFDPYQAGALDAMYIKVSDNISFIYPVSSEPTFPSSKEMKVGWNFVGLAQLYEMSSADALEDAFWGTGETGLFGYNKVISPSLNGDSWSYVPRDGTATMCPLKGYWVFMVNDGWLGGFTSTPIVEVEGGK